MRIHVVRRWSWLVLALLYSGLVAAATVERIADINPQLTFTDPRPFPYKTGWVFTALNHPYFTDGTPANTRALASDHVTGGPFVPYNGSIYYLGAYPAPINSQSSFFPLTLFRTDGTRAGTSPVYPGNPQSRSVEAIAVLGASLYVFSSGTMYRTDGTEAGSVAIVDSSVNLGRILTLNGRMLYFGTSPTGNGLIASDGTAAGTAPIANVNGFEMTVVGNKAFFWIGMTLWVTDGTAAGTMQLPNPAPAFGDFGNIVGANGVAYTFVRADLTHAQLVRSDGTPGGTRTVGPPIEFTRPFDIYSDGARVYFFATPGNVTYELWQSDGTDAGTMKTTLPAPYDTGRGMKTIDGVVYVLVSSAASGWQLYRDDNGTWTPFSAATTMPVAAFGPQLLYPPNSIGARGETPRILTAAPDEPDESASCTRNMAALGTRWTFIATSTDRDGCSLYATDGTTAGTVLLMAPPSGTTLQPNTTFPAVTPAGGFAYFSVGNTIGDATRRLYVTDGTPQGTMPVQAPDGSTATVQWSSVRDWNGQLAFADASNRVMAANGASARVLATAAGAVPAILSRGSGFVWIEQRSDNVIGVMGYDGGVTELSVATSPSPFLSYNNGVTSGNRVFYWLRPSTFGEASPLYVTDGTSAGTTLVRTFQGLSFDTNLAVRGGALVTAVENSTETMYFTDGTAAGTVALAGHRGAFRGISDGNHAWFMESPNSSPISLALWRTDGTPPGTVKIADIPPSDGWPTLTVYKGSLFFFAAASGTGRELWVSNGTSAAGTRVLADYTPGPANSLFNMFPWEPLPAVNDAFTLFMAHEGDGLEPHIVRLDAFPDGIFFNDVSFVSPGTTVVSDPVVVTGLDVGVPATASNGQVCVSSAANCACDVAPYATQVLANQAQYLCARHTASSVPGGSTTTEITFGSSLARFTSHTTASASGVTLSVARGGTGNGRVVSSPAGVDCGASCSASFPSGSGVTLTATAIAGERFTGWSGGGCMGTSPCTVTLSSATSVTANFAVYVAHHVAARDLDGDGMADLLWIHPSGAQGAWLMDGDGFRQRGTFTPPADGARMAMTGDFDGDGHTDVLWTTDDGRYFITLMDGFTVKASATLLGCCTGWTVIGKGDFNGDGKTDLFLRHSSGQNGLWLMDGVAISQASVVASPSTGAIAKLFADLDGDGRTDIVWQRADGGIDGSRMSGVTVLESRTMLPGGTGWSATFTGDLDGDGKADLLLANDDGSQGAWLMDGLTIRQPALLIGAGTGWHVRFVADFDGDGKADLAWGHDDGTWGAWLMDGVTRRDAGVWLGAGTGWSIYAADDFDGDGKADLLWRHSSGEYGAWLMDGLAARSHVSLLPGGTGWEVLH